MINWTKVFSFLLNNVNIDYLVASMLIGTIGGSLYAIIYALHGTKNNPKTPTTFNIWYFIGHNGLRFLAGNILIFIYCVFMPKLVGENATLIGSFIIGFFTDGLLVLILHNSTSVFKLISNKVLTFLKITSNKN